jgi:hypothetical protein
MSRGMRHDGRLRLLAIRVVVGVIGFIQFPEP